MSDTVRENPIALSLSPCCNAAWGGGDTTGANVACTRCGLTHDDITSLMAPVFALYEQARVVALAGDWATARRLLADAFAAGLPMGIVNHAPRRLEALCAVVSGDWAILLSDSGDGAALLDTLPPYVREAVTNPARVAVLAADDARARRFAALGNFDAAQIFADECVHAAPFWAGAHELQRLCAAGVVATAAAVQAAVVASSPAPAPDAAIPVADPQVGNAPPLAETERKRTPRLQTRRAVAPRRASVVAAPEKENRRTFRRQTAQPMQTARVASRPLFSLSRVLPVAAAALSLAACCAAVAVVLRASAVPPAAATTQTDKGERIKEEKERRSQPVAQGAGHSSFTLHPSSFPSPPPSEADARRLFNLAVAAKRAGLWAEAARLAQAAHARAGGTYLADESLLLWAQASDNSGSVAAATVASRYRRLADETPRSPYAPLALREAARAARRAGLPGDAARDMARRRAVYGK